MGKYVSLKLFPAGLWIVFGFLLLCFPKTGLSIDDSGNLKTKGKLFQANPNLLLITAQELATEWQSFADWKTAHGIPTKIVTVEEIDQLFPNGPIQEKIRRCVREHIDHHHTQWVLLGGDCLPDGEGLVPGGHTTVHMMEPKGIPTDIVYISPTDWDADGDGVYGEFDDDRDAITYPDGSIGLGRVPVRTAEDVKAYTVKVVEYESGYPETEFAHNMVYTCTDSPAYPKVINSWDKYVSKAWEGSVERFFSHKTPWDEPGKDGSYDLSPDHLTKLLNSKRAGKVHIHGHGFLPAWVLENGKYFTKENVAQLDHPGAYPLITTVSCFTGQYDSNTDPSIVEQMIRKPQGGSVAVVAPVRTGKPHFAKQSDFRLMITEGKLDGTTLTMTRYWSNGLGKNLSTGHAFMTAKAQMAENGAASRSYHLCICELNLLGDPTLDMRANNPRRPKLDVPQSIPLATQTLTIRSGIPETQICIWKKGEIYSVGKADGQGQLKIKITPQTTGVLKVTAFGPSINVVTQDIEVVGAD